MKLCLYLFLVLFNSSVIWAGQLEKDLVNGTSFNQMDKVRTALEKGADINGDRGDGSGFTALILATMKNNQDIALFLIEKGADVTKANTQKKTALLFAAKAGNEILVQKLLEKGANPNAEDTFGYSPLQMALMNNQYKLLKYFYDSGLNLDAKVIKNRWTPIEYALLKITRNQ